MAVVVAGAIVALAMRQGDEPGRTAPTKLHDEDSVGFDGVEELTIPALSRDPLPDMDSPLGKLQEGDSVDAKLLWMRWVDRHGEATFARGTWVGLRDRSPNQVLTEEAHGRYFNLALAALEAEALFYKQVARPPPPSKRSRTASAGADGTAFGYLRVALRIREGAAFPAGVSAECLGPGGERALGTYSDADPEFAHVVEFGALAPGKWEVVIRASGHKPIRGAVEVRSGIGYSAFATLIPSKS